jgi:hypothetical protein
LLKQAGEETWENRKELSRAAVRQAGRGVDSIRQFVRAITAAIQRDRRKDIDVSIVGDGLRFRLALGDEDGAIDTVARSVYLMQRIRRVVDEIKDRVNEHDPLLGKVDVTLEADGFTLMWHTPEGNGCARPAPGR